MINLKKNRVNEFAIVILVLTFAFMFLPYFLYGKNCVITIHDNLDSNIPWFKYVRDNAYYFNLNTKSTTLDNLSTLYFAGDFTYKGIIYYIFDTFIAYNIIYISSIIFGLISMNLLLLHIFKDKKSKWVVLLVSLVYSVLPVFPGYRIAVSTLPFGILLLYNIYIEKKHSIGYYLCLLLFPFFSSFDCILIFLLGYLFLLIIFISVKEKNVNFRLVISFLLIAFGTIITNIRLFMMRLVYYEPLNRDIMNISLVRNTSFSVTNLIRVFTNYFCKGFYHAYSLHLYIILPITFVWFLLLLKGTFEKKFSFNNNVINHKIKVVIACVLLIIFNCIIITLDDLMILYRLFKLVLPQLAGLSFARLYIFNNVLWYIIFASMLLSIMEAQVRYKRVLVFAIVLVQLLIVMFKDNYYQDSWKSWKANVANDCRNVSYKEFFSESLFNQIKSDIKYNGEISIAIGYHPSVLMYNGFNTADGYISTYPMMDALRFKELIQPELDVNNWANDYYTSWWGRRYIYNKDLPYEPTKAKNNKKIDLRINIEFYKNYYKGKYIISRAEISNYKELGLKYVNSYKSDDSIYDLWVYNT